MRHMVCILSQNYYLGILDHTVAFLSHVGISRNFNQVILLHTKFIRGTTNHKKRNVSIIAHFQSLSPLLVSMILRTGKLEIRRSIVQILAGSWNFFQG